MARDPKPPKPGQTGRVLGDGGEVLFESDDPRKVAEAGNRLADAARKAGSPRLPRIVGFDSTELPDDAAGPA